MVSAARWPAILPPPEKATPSRPCLMLLRWGTHYDEQCDVQLVTHPLPCASIHLCIRVTRCSVRERHRVINDCCAHASPLPRSVLCQSARSQKKGLFSARCAGCHFLNNFLQSRMLAVLSNMDFRIVVDFSPSVFPASFISGCTHVASGPSNLTSKLPSPLRLPPAMAALLRALSGEARQEARLCQRVAPGDPPSGSTSLQRCPRVPSARRL